MVAALAGLFVFALASSWDVGLPVAGGGHGLGPLPALRGRGRDARATADRRPVRRARPTDVRRSTRGRSASTASFLILDGDHVLVARVRASSFVSAVSVLSMYAAAGALWGVGAGLVAAAAYAVSPIRLDPMYWHGVGTTLAFVFLPLVVLSLGLMYRGTRELADGRLLALALAGDRGGPHNERGHRGRARGRGAAGRSRP